MQARSTGGANESSLLQIYIIMDHVPYVMLPALYKKMDAFVLPSRGEGRQQALSLESFLDLYLLLLDDIEIESLALRRIYRMGTTAHGSHGNGSSGDCHELERANCVSK